MNASNQRTFQAVRNEYPYVTQHANARMFIFSRIPFESSRYVDHKIGTFPQPMATFQVDGKEFAVVGIHTSTALSHIGWKQRNLELTRTADLVRQLDTPAIVTGDMNVSSFSANFQNFLVAGGLVDGRIGQGLYATWPVFIPFVQIPIDHFVATPDVQVTRFANGSYTGSDHRPIVIDFNLTIEP